jgi:hypothetical protein
MSPHFRHLALSVLCVAAGAFALATGPAAAAPASLPHGVSDIPLAARGPVSNALGGRAGEYQVTGRRARNRAQDLEARFTGDGATVESDGAQVRLGLVASGRAGALRRVGPASPRTAANRVEYSHPGVD